MNTFGQKIQNNWKELPTRLFIRNRCRRFDEEAVLGRQIRIAGENLVVRSREEDLAGIFTVREELANSDEIIAFEDFGTGKRSVPGAWVKPEKSDYRHVSEIYRRSAIPHVWGAFLYHLSRSVKPQNVLELGTNLGMSALYFQAALRCAENLQSGGHLYTIEGDPTLAGMAERRLRATGSNTTVINGTFEESLPAVCKMARKFDLVFIDGHHDENAAIHYVEMIRPYLSNNAIIILDDTEPWAGNIRRAFNRLRAGRDICGTLDLLKMAILVYRGDEN